jgi:type III pantothenate kinase
VDGIVEKMKSETKTKAKVVATGGMAVSVASGCKTIDEVDELLTLKGLKLIYEANS